VDFAFTEDQERFRAEVRAFCEQTDPQFDDPAKSHGLKGGYSSAFYRELGRRGWLGLQIPTAYGGAGRPPIYEAIFAEELGRSAAPAGNYAGTVLEFGHLILRHGSERQRQTYLPRVASGEIRAGHAYTEPDAGSDLAAVRTTAVRDGDDYVVTGTKLYASEVNRTDYSVLMARTTRSGVAEAGISLFILDNRAAGVSHTRLATLGGKGTNVAYLDGVRIPASDLIGEENRGWAYFLDIRAEYWTKNQGYFCGTLARLLDQLLRFVREDAGGARADDPLVRQRLARLAIDLEGMRWLTYRLATAARPHEETALIATLKVLTDTLILRFGDEAMSIVGRDSLLAGPDALAGFGTALENRYRENVLKHFSSLGHAFARSALAADGLGLPAMER
jgi:alkylation response protein AidB-like acyl-CoA dehydrogenase